MQNLFFYLILWFLVVGCKSTLGSKKLITVNGAIPIKKIGVTLVHEHIMVDWIGADSTGQHRWNKAAVIKRAMPFLIDAQKKGVNTFFDCTPAYIGRDPILLKKISESTGMHIVTNTGYYGAVNNKFMPKHAFKDSAKGIAQIWIDEFEHGIDGTKIIPGFIKISVGVEDTLSQLHAKIVKAAAIAHKKTGMTIVSHTGPDGPAFAQMEILNEQGVSSEAFVWTHAQNGTLNGQIKAAKQGAWISLDHVQSGPSDPLSQNKNTINWYVNRLTALKKEKLLHKILLSHDSGWYNVGQENGGNYRGYTAIFDHLIPVLKENGFTRKDIDVLLIKNPQNAYALNKRTIK
ncbi:phosphotriesterase family protein [Aquimarina agarivorans]|uniref:phosphotriesterase family protein n=1 Tax=Aquimarina agarivorans TaxID=980584 RepID=UPI000248E6DD|nr:phosphotriesterase [Aquimarina agarivorans]